MFVYELHIYVKHIPTGLAVCASTISPTLPRDETIMPSGSVSEGKNDTPELMGSCEHTDAWYSSSRIAALDQEIS